MLHIKIIHFFLIFDIYCIIIHINIFEKVFFLFSVIVEYFENIL